MLESRSVGQEEQAGVFERGSDIHITHIPRIRHNTYYK
jgi:hypothetical protein